MEMYDWDVLINRWEIEDLTMDQVIGQLLLRGQSATDLLRSLGITVENLERRVKTLEKWLTALEERRKALEKRQKRQN